MWLFIHPSVDEGCFHVLTVMNNAAVTLTCSSRSSCFDFFGEDTQKWGGWLTCHLSDFVGTTDLFPQRPCHVALTWLSLSSLSPWLRRDPSLWLFHLLGCSFSAFLGASFDLSKHTLLVRFLALITCS